MAKTIGLGLLTIGLAGYAYTQYQRWQAVQWAQLQVLDDTLAGQNAQVQKDNDDALRHIQVTVENNRNQAQELVILNEARQVQHRAQELLATIRAYRERLLRQTANYNSVDLLRHPAAEITLADLQATGQQPSLQARLRAYVRYTKAIRSRYPSALLQRPALAPPSLPVSWPTSDASDKQLVGLALANLSQLETAVMTAEASALEWLEHGLAPRRIPRKLVAVATAETDVLAAGATYKAQVYLVNSLYGPSISMSCNGQPVTVGPNGLGDVHFQAPVQPGAAAWQGQIRLHHAGRDSVFHVRVPYRVARP